MANEVWFKRVRFSKMELLTVMSNAAPGLLSELTDPANARIFVEEDPADSSFMIIEFEDSDPST